MHKSATLHNLTCVKLKYKPTTVEKIMFETRAYELHFTLLFRKQLFPSGVLQSRKKTLPYITRVKEKY